MTFKRIIVNSLLWIVFSIVMTACGGGSNNGGLPPNTKDNDKEIETTNTVPDNFEFAEGEAVDLNMELHSDPITISGINKPTSIRIENGEYSVDGEPFTSEDGTVENGQEVVVRHTTSSLNATSTETVLTIGGVTASYLTTTLAYDGQLAIVSSGADLVLMGMNSDGELEERSRDTHLSELADYSSNHTIFSVTTHPSEDMVFVTSMNECGAIPFASGGCWGNARVDRFTYDSNTISYDGVAFLAQGPLRFSTPSFDEESSELRMVLRNQGNSTVSINELIARNLTTGSSFESNCGSIELTRGDTCELVITAGEGAEATANIDIETSIASFSTEVSYSERLEGYTANGLSTAAHLDGLPRCATNDFEMYNQLGGCALTAMAISADGTRAYINEDDEDVALVMSLDDSGGMTFITESDRIYLQGLAVNADGTAMYNGSNAYEIFDDVVTSTNDGYGGNATELVSGPNGENLLVSTIDNSDLSIFELDTDPLAPVLIDSATPLAGNARFQAHSKELDTFVTVSFKMSSESNLTAYIFEGAILTESGSLDTTVEFDDCDECDYGAFPRKVQLTDSGAFAVTAVFVNARDEKTAEQVPYMGAAVSYSIDTDTDAGTSEIAEVDRLTFDGMARALLFVDTP